MVFQATETSLASAGADHVEVRDGAQGGELFHGLVRRAVLAQADRVVRPYVDGRDAHQGAERRMAGRW